MSMHENDVMFVVQNESLFVFHVQSYGGNNIISNKFSIYHLTKGKELLTRATRGHLFCKTLNPKMIISFSSF